MPPPIGLDENLGEPSRYPQKDFFEDFQLALKIVEQAHGSGSLSPKLLDHFELKYPDKIECRWRRQRCLAAVKYWIRHQTDLGARDGPYLLPKEVLFVLWMTWTIESNNPAKFDPPIEMITKAVRHFSEKWGNSGSSARN